MFIDIRHLGCLTALPPQKPLWTVWVTRMVSWHFLGISTYVLLDSTTSTTSFFLCGLLALLLIPSIHFPTHPLIHSSIHTSTHHPSTQVPIHPGTDGWTNERMGEWMGKWMCGWVYGRMVGWMDDRMGECLCWLIVSSSLGLREIKPRQRPYL